ncbi:MAG TPA: cytochrome P450, partial [Candidatus Binatia bacterium]|nr:cytochrome P450 [Candidatus Binatia bacterium]
MDANERRIPPGPDDKYKVGEDLLGWMDRHFKTFGDTYKATVFGATIYATRDVEVARHVLVDNWQNYVKGQSIARVALLLGKGLMVSKGNLWKRQRRMIQPAFTQESVATAVKLISSTNAALLKKWQLAADANEGVNVTKDVSSMALEVVLRFIFGEDYEQVAPHFDFLSSEPARNIEFARTFRALGKVILQIVEQRRKNSASANGILDTLTRAHDPDSGKPMPDDQLIDEVLTLIVAGHETTASTLAWCWYLLSQHPEAEEKLSDELSSLSNPIESLAFSDLPRFGYTRQIVEETMRLFPAGWVVTRKALHDDRLGDYFVPAGTEIYVVLYSIQRHPDLWDDPDRFDPERFRPERSNDRHRLAAMPFSAGPRNCIGALFARTEMQIHVMTIARQLRLRYVQSKPLELDAGVNLR